MTFALFRLPSAKASPWRWPPLLFALALALPAMAQQADGGQCADDTTNSPQNCTVEHADDTAANDKGSTAAAALDWIDEQAVPEELRDQKCRVCGGRFIDPLQDVDRSVPLEEFGIKANATSTELLGNTIFLNGGVIVEQGYRTLKGDSATIDREQQSAVLEGNITLREPGILIRGEHAEIHSETGVAVIDDSSFVLHQQHLRGSAGQLRRDEQGIVYLEDGNLSFCPPESSDWLLRSDEMELDPVAGVGIAKGAKIDVRGVPVFYLPWLRFPLDDRRRTGVLWPNIGSDSRGGLDLSAPIYLNLAPHYDAQYTPRFIQERGLSHQLTTRYLGETIGSWAVGGAFLQNDDLYRQEVPDASSHDRWLGTVQHQGLYEQRWRSEVNYSKVSDVDYLKDLDTSSLDTKRQSNLLQLASLDYLGDKWLVNMDLQKFQSLADDIAEDYQKLPQITAQYRGVLAPFELEPIAELQYSYFDSEGERVTGQRLYAEAGLNYPMAWSYGFLNSKVKYRHLEYDLSDSLIFRDEERPTAGTPLVNLDSGLYFERATKIAGRGLMQTLEPRVYYLYSKFSDQSDQPDFDTAELTFNYNQLFRETRFSGRDRLDDANQLSLGVTTRFINEEDGREHFSASLGQIFYFDDRRVRLKPLDPPLVQSGSELAGELNFAPNERTNLRAGVVWDPYSGNVNSGNLTTSYQRGDGSIYGIGYTYRRPLTLLGIQPVTEQLHLSAYLPMRDNWSIFASLNYSLEAETSVEDMFGVEYDSCCWKVRLLHLRYFDTVPGGTTDFDSPDLQRKYSTQVQIILKGLGGFGDGVENLLEDMIRGYTPREI